MSACRSCGAAIVWKVTAAGKRMPLDAEPGPTGNVDVTFVGGEEVALVLGKADALAAQADGHVLYVPHWATCPTASEHRS